MSTLREAVNRSLYRLGWRVGPRIPKVLRAVIMSAGATAANLQDGVHVRELRHNLSVAAGHPITRAVVREGVASDLRNWFEILALPGWSAEQIRDRVTTTDEHHLRDAFATTGAVVALPHSGNWDLAGAWACLTGMPVTTVAEQLGDQEFRAFLAFRESLGMEVLSHTDPSATGKLITAVNAGRLVCLVADRDLVGSGVPVRWGSTDITMPAGPALVARRAGAALIPAVCQFTDTGMVIKFGAPIAPRPGRDGLVAMTQEVTDFFADRIAERPVDWHLMQPFFRTRSEG